MFSPNTESLHPNSMPSRNMGVEVFGRILQEIQPLEAGIRSVP